MVAGPWTIAGIIEGFYGRPWSWDERSDVLRYCREHGMTHYVYTPKDDPRHRDRWREAYDDATLDGFSRLVGDGTLTVGFGISPGLSIDYESADDRTALATKVDQVLERGVRLVCLALDDIPFAPGLGECHASLTRWLADHVGDRADVVLVPTEYVGTRSTAYLDALAAGVPAGVPIAWTGDAVVNDAITADQARARADALGGRLPLVWDNFPVNDGIMTDRLHLGPLWGRDPALRGLCTGYLANPMVQPQASKLPLASAAAFTRGDDPLDGWAAAADRLGWRVFAEACDGAVPLALVHALGDKAFGGSWTEAARPLASWLLEAAECAAPGLEEEAAAWLDQVHAEAALCLDALRLIQCARPLVRVDASGRGRVLPPDDDLAFLYATALWGQWPRARRSRVSVLGVRLGFRPELAQRADGRWAYRAGSLLEGSSATDELCRLALAYLERMEIPTPVVVEVDGSGVDVDADGWFDAASGSFVSARAGDAMTRCKAPCDPPLPDPRG